MKASSNLRYPLHNALYHGLNLWRRENLLVNCSYVKYLLKKNTSILNIPKLVNVQYYYGYNKESPPSFYNDLGTMNIAFS